MHEQRNIGHIEYTYLRVTTYVPLELFYMYSIGDHNMHLFVYYLYVLRSFLNIMIIEYSRIQSRFIVCIDFPIFQCHLIDIGKVHRQV